MSFVPDVIDDIPAHAGSSVSGFNFTGFVHASIRGRVVAAGGGPMSGVTVTATEAGADDDAEPTASVVTGRTGSFVLSVPYDRYTIAATAPATSLTRFSYPDDEQDIRVAPGQSVNFGNITGESVNGRIVSTSRVKDDAGAYTGDVNIRWEFDNVDGWTGITHTVEHCVTDCGEATATWTSGSFTADTSDDTEDDADEGLRVGTFTAPDSNEGDLGFSVRVSVTASEPVDGSTESRTGSSDVETVARVDASPSDIEAMRQTLEAATVDSLIVNWEASTNSRTVTRVIITLDMGAAGTQSLVAAGRTALTDDATSATWIVSGFSATDWTIADSDPAQTLNVTEADLRKALEVRVETRQAEEVDDDDDPVWKATAEVEVDADPEDS